MTAASTELAIDLQQVAKVYRGRVHALAGIEMRVRRGEIFGLLGPNGAGKSTLVKIMMTVVKPTQAVGTILGAPIGHKATLRRVGYLPENHRFPRYLTGRQVVEFFASLAGMARALRKRRAAELLEIVGMREWADRRITTYSKGMMQRVGLAQALANDPDLVLLDEPTDGVDPGGRRDIRQVLGHMRDLGKTVFVNSHLLSELEVISNRVAILVGGRVARQGTMEELTVAKQRYEIEVAAPEPHLGREALLQALPAQFTATAAPPAAYAPTQAGAQIGGLPPSLPPRSGPPPITMPPPIAFPMPPAMTGSAAPAAGIIDKGTLPDGHWIEVQGPVIRIGSVEPGEIQSLLDRLRQGRWIIRRVQVVRPSLEELFLDTVTNQVNPGRGQMP